MKFWIWSWRTLFFSKFKKNFVDFSPSSYHLHLHVTFAPSINLSYISSSSDLIYYNFGVYCNRLNLSLDLLTYIQGIFYFTINLNAYFGIWYREFSELELHILPFHLIIIKIFRVEIFFHVLDNIFEFFCKIFITVISSIDLEQVLFLHS